MDMAGRAHSTERAPATHRALPEEVPVALVFNGTTQAVMMATPANIADFAVGFALSEGAVTALDQIESFEILEHAGGIEARCWLGEDRAAALVARRRVMAGPVGCGLCGIDSLAEANRPVPVVPERGLRLTRGEVAGATEQLRRHQPLRDQSCAIHAAGFLRPGAGLVMVREDVGRHNALDKLIGALAREGIDASTGAFVLSSRVSVELVQKTAMAGCPVLVALSAPTALAVRIAAEAGITLAAFARGGGFETFTHPCRIAGEASDAA